MCLVLDRDENPAIYACRLEHQHVSEHVESLPPRLVNVVQLNRIDRLLMPHHDVKTLHLLPTAIMTASCVVCGISRKTG